MAPVESAALIAAIGAIGAALIGVIGWWLRNGRRNNPGTPDRLCRAVELMIENQQSQAHYLEGVENRAVDRHLALMGIIQEMYNTLAPRRFPSGPP